MKARAVLAIAAAIVVAACADPSSDSGGLPSPRPSATAASPIPQPTTVSTTSATAECEALLQESILEWIEKCLPGRSASGTELPIHAAECPVIPAGTDLEGFFDASQMICFVTWNNILMGDWLRATYTAMPFPSNVWIYHSSQAGNGPCGPVNEVSYEYCSLDRSIHLGQAAVWSLYDVQGDAAAAAGIWHELGHHLQLQTGVWQVAMTREDRIKMENQADCVMGAIAGWAQQQGILSIDDDLADMDALLILIQAFEGPDREHGTLQERVDSTLLGLNQGLSACNQFFPLTPLITAP